MLICERTKYEDLNTIFTNEAPFTYKSLPSAHETADYWINIFGCPDETTTIIIFIKSVIEDYIIKYSETTSIINCIYIESSFYWSVSDNKLYLHLTHDNNKYTSDYEYGKVEGFSDKRSIYIDGLFYRSLLISIPSIAQQQDLINYDQLSFISGIIELRNSNGVLDYLKNESIIGTNVYIYFLDDSDKVEDYSRSQLIDLRTFYIENYNSSLRTVSLDAQDIRKRKETMIPVDKFTVSDYPDINEKYIDDIIPLMYGQVRYSEAIPVDGDAGSGTITYRQALILTTIGTVQVEIDDLWTTKTPVSTDLNTGSFTLAEADGRKANGQPYKCRVYNSIGILNTYSSDIIIDLNNRYLRIPFADGSYDVAEWAAEEISLESIGILFNEEIELYEAIRRIQTESNIGFRYEINASGHSTIRIDNDSRTQSDYIYNTEIKNIEDSEVSTQQELLSAIVQVDYAYDYDLKKYLSYENESEIDTVKQQYRQKPKITIPTSLTSEAQAIARSELYLEKHSEIPKIVNLNLTGKDHYTKRIYDIIEVEITMGFVNADTGEVESGREFYGIWTAKILGIDPQFDTLGNNITVNLLEKIEPVTIVRVTTSGAIRSIGRVGTSVIKRAVGE